MISIVKYLHLVFIVISDVHWRATVVAEHRRLDFCDCCVRAFESVGVDSAFFPYYTISADPFEESDRPMFFRNVFLPGMGTGK